MPAGGPVAPRSSAATAKTELIPTAAVIACKPHVDLLEKKSEKPVTFFAGRRIKR